MKSLFKILWEGREVYRGSNLKESYAEFHGYFDKANFENVHLLRFLENDKVIFEVKGFENGDS